MPTLRACEEQTLHAGGTPSQRRRYRKSVLASSSVSSDGLDAGVKAVYLDRGFYGGKCLTLLQARNYAYVIPIIRWGEAIQQRLSEGWSRVIQHDLTETRRSQLDRRFPVYIDCTYLNGKYDENGVARHGYAADAPFIDSPRDARYHYSKRFGIESSYRLFEQAIAINGNTRSTVRLLYVVVSLLLQNVWRYLHYEYVATPAERASPLVVAVKGVRQYDSTSCVDGLACVGPSPRIGHLTTDSPLTTDRASQPG